MPKPKRKRKRIRARKKTKLEQTLSQILFRSIRERAKKWKALHQARKDKIQILSDMIKLTKKQLDFYKREEQKASAFKEQTAKTLNDEGYTLMSTMSFFLRRYDKMARGALKIQASVSKKLSEEKALNEGMASPHFDEMKRMEKESSSLSNVIHAKRLIKNNVDEYLKECYELNDIKFTNLVQYLENLKSLHEEQLSDVQEILDRNLRKNKAIFDKELEDCAAPSRPDIVNRLSLKTRSMVIDNTIYRRHINRLRCCETFTKLFIAFLKRDINYLLCVPSDKESTREMIAPGFAQPKDKCQPEDDVDLNIPLTIYVPF